MKTVTIDNVEYEKLDWVEGFMSNEESVIILRPLPNPRKTIEEVADDMGCEFHVAVARAAENRFRELEARIAKLEAKS